jgi:hypothetical protein
MTTGTGRALNCRLILKTDIRTIQRLPRAIKVGLV